MNFAMKKVEMGEDSDKSSIRNQIDENLKKVYQDALNEEVPDKFRDLLEQLKKKEGGS
ncbi:NepR family anti-sigma factor [Wenxinia saemankumensis]|uniref:Anti-sigma factor NepR domain-containing protein n=1 Tax=Wenxinia saemankumensis TaxID=1447782 RepID=A0A1M6ER82_9RHOB|nr:NepR family anti-sigma factor [Wenxinia saemankumensis]SHI87991.1 hypothetical protein SAMN05444417_2133 [Wenxinia saemankumensis]